MNDLLGLTIRAHGGLERWNQLVMLSARASFEGALWTIKGKAGMLDDIGVTIELHREWTSHSPFGAPDHFTVVTADQVLIENTEGDVVDELEQPRGSFRGHTLQTQWTDPQLAYFIGYGLWNYLTFPFSFTMPGFEVEELGTWEENGETWRRLQVTFPDYIATHCKVQTCYIAEDGRLRRHDYDVDINGGTPGAHYFSDYTTVAGIALPTQHRIYLRNPDLSHEMEPLIVSIGISDVRFQ